MREGGEGGRRNMEGGHPAALPTKLKSVLIRFGSDRSSKFETDVVSSYQLRIRQISTCWKDNFMYFPMGRPSYTSSSRTGRTDENKSTIVYRIFKLGKLRYDRFRPPIAFIYARKSWLLGSNHV